MPDQVDTIIGEGLADSESLMEVSSIEYGKSDAHIIYRKLSRWKV